MTQHSDRALHWPARGACSMKLLIPKGVRAGAVEALRYKSEGRGFDFRWGVRVFSLG